MIEKAKVFMEFVKENWLIAALGLVVAALAVGIAFALVPHGAIGLNLP